MMQPPENSDNSRPGKSARSPALGSDGPTTANPRAGSSKSNTGAARDPERAGRQPVEKAGGYDRPVPTRRPAARAQSTDQPSSVRMEGLRTTGKTPMTSGNVVHEKTSSRTPVDPLKPVLKKNINEEPSVKTTKKSKRFKRKPDRTDMRNKSVTFVAEPDSTATSIPPVNYKPATRTGFSELPAKDFFVILAIWSMRFFIPWIDAWHNFNFYLLREPSFWDPLENDIRTQEIIVFCVMSTITILVSVFADLVHCKFFVFLGLLLLFVLCPLVGGMLNSVLVARAYNQEFYRRWAFTCDTLFHWAFAIALFVSFPIQLTCIFEQNDVMSKQAHYNWIAFFVLLEAINRYVAFWEIPGKCPTRTFTQTVIWFVMGVIISIVLLFNANFTLMWAKPTMLHSKWRLQDSKLKKQDPIELTSKRPRKFICFLFILISLIITSFVFATLERLYPDEDWDKHYIWSATSMFHFGEIIGTALLAVVLSIARWKLQYFYRLPFLRPDVLALGLPHVINCIALVTLLGRYALLSSLNEGDVIVGPIPEEKKMVVEFYNFDYRNRTICVHSSAFRPIKISPRGRGTREIYNTGLSRIHFTVTLDPKTTPGLMSTESFGYQDDTWATFVITLPYSNVKYSDVQALYSKPEIIGVEGTQGIRPKKTPQIYFMNTFVLQNTSRYMWMFLVRDNAGFKEEFKYNLRWQTVIINVPRGHLEVVYHLVNSTSTPQAVMTTIEAEDYSVWAVLLGHARNLKPGERFAPRMLKAYKTVEVAGPYSTSTPSKAQLQRDGAIMVGMTFAGMASSGMFIGMIYLFWLDTPYMNYRTTCIGVFWVLLYAPAELSKIKVIDISFYVIMVLTLLQTVCTIVQFIFASKLYSPKFNFRDRSD